MIKEAVGPDKRPVSGIISIFDTFAPSIMFAQGNIEILYCHTIQIRTINLTQNVIQTRIR